MKRTPALFLFLVQLFHPTLSLVVSGQKSPQHRLNPFWPLRLSTTESGADDSNQYIEHDANLFERTVRKVTRSKSYKFGDLTKSAASLSTKTFEGAVRTVTQDDNYSFGDYSKKVVSSTTQTFEDTVKSITKNEDYQFGDLTRVAVDSVKSSAGKVLTYSEKTLSLLRDANIHELVELLNFFWTNNMTFEEQREAFVVLVYLGAIIVLAYSSVANLMSGMVFAAAWYKVSITTGTSPLSTWSTLLQTKATLDMIFGGPFLPLRVGLTIPWFFKYRQLVVGTAYLSPLREKYPILNRCFSLVVSWSLVNLFLAGSLTYGMVKFASLRSGVPIFPV